jgi:hypothetical protein
MGNTPRRFTGLEALRFEFECDRLGATGRRVRRLINRVGLDVGARILCPNNAHPKRELPDCVLDARDEQRTASRGDSAVGLERHPVLNDAAAVTDVDR